MIKIIIFFESLTLFVFLSVMKGIVRQSLKIQYLAEWGVQLLNNKVHAGHQVMTSKKNRWKNRESREGGDETRRLSTSLRLCFLTTILTTKKRGFSRSITSLQEACHLSDTPLLSASMLCSCLDCEVLWSDYYDHHGWGWFSCLTGCKTWTTSSRFCRVFMRIVLLHNISRPERWEDGVSEYERLFILDNSNATPWPYKEVGLNVQEHDDQGGSLTARESWLGECLQFVDYTTQTILHNLLPRLHICFQDRRNTESEWVMSCCWIELPITKSSVWTIERPWSL